MKQEGLQILYSSFNQFEMNLLQQRMDDFESNKNIRFTSLDAYINHLAVSVREKQRNGEFIPRNVEESKAGYYLLG